VRSAWPAKASDWPPNAGRSDRTVPWSFQERADDRSLKGHDDEALFLATAAFAALVMVAPVGKAGLY
jgi:hypothetical protein